MSRGRDGLLSVTHVIPSAVRDLPRMAHRASLAGDPSLRSG